MSPGGEPNGASSGARVVLSMVPVAFCKTVGLVRGGVAVVVLGLVTPTVTVVVRLW